MIILIGSQKGGCGKTTLAINMAAWLAEQKKDVVLVDADLQGSASNWVKDREQTNYQPVHCVQRYDDIRATLKDLKSRYEYVIVDVAGHDSKELRTAMLACDVLVVPFRPSQFDLDTLPHLSEMVEQAQEINEALKSCAVLALAPTNPVVSEIEEAMSYIADYPLFERMDTVIYDRKVYREIAGTGAGVIEATNPKAREEINAFMQELLK